jgi:hypothetical protein
MSAFSSHLFSSSSFTSFIYSFLADQYYQKFSEDPEVPYLRNIGFFSMIKQNLAGEATTADFVKATSPAASTTTAVAAGGAKNPNIFPVKTLKKRLEMFLQVFAAVVSPKQLFCHQMLYAYYHELMAKADVSAVKLAFSCILTYKPAAIVPYKDGILRMLEDKSLRDELVNFDPTPTALLLAQGQGYGHNNSSSGSGGGGGGAVDPYIQEIHRPELVPLLIRTVYGRFTSKSRGSKAARDQNIARCV